MKNERLWTRDFILAMATGFFLSMVTYSLLITIAVYSMGKYNVPEGLAGFAASISLVGGIFGRIFAGKYTDRIGRRRIAIIGNALNVLLCALYFIPMNFFMFLALRTVHGAVVSWAHNVMATAVVDIIPSSRRAEGLSFYSLHFTLTTALGPPLGLFVISKWSYTVFWGVNLCFALIATIVLAFIRFAPVSFTKEQLSQVRGKGLGGILEKSVIPIAIVSALLSICYTGVIAFVEIYTSLIGIAWIASPFFIIYALVIIASRPVAGRLVDRRGENFVLIPSIILFSISLVVFGLAGEASVILPVLMFASAVMMATGFGTILPIGQAIVIKYSEPLRFSKSLSTFFIFSDGGMGFGALLMGSIASITGFSKMYFIEAAVGLAALAVYWQLHGKNHRGL